MKPGSLEDETPMTDLEDVAFGDGLDLGMSREGSERIPMVIGSNGLVISPTYKWGIPWGYNPISGQME